VTSESVVDDATWNQSASSVTSSQCTVKMVTVTSSGDHVTSHHEVGHVTENGTSAQSETHCDRKQFKTGVKCHDVATALNILCTRYQLADVTVHKNIITWSSWNIADIIRTPHKDSCWHSEHVEPEQQQQQSECFSNAELCGRIESREQEIEHLVESRTQQVNNNPPPKTKETSDDVTKCHQSIYLACAQPPERPELNKRTQHNFLHRLIDSIRRRLSRQQTPPSPPPPASRRLRTL
jgi:hypothetical protein